MNVNSYISALVQYGLDKELFEPCDKAFIINQLISSLQLSSYEPVAVSYTHLTLPTICSV